MLIPERLWHQKNADTNPYVSLALIFSLATTFLWPLPFSGHYFSPAPTSLWLLHFSSPYLSLATTFLWLLSFSAGEWQALENTNYREQRYKSVTRKCDVWHHRKQRQAPRRLPFQVPEVAHSGAQGCPFLCHGCPFSSRQCQYHP